MLDVDVKHGKDGVASLTDLGFADPRALSPSPTETPSNGLHLFFAYDPRLTNTVGAIGAGLDVRNDHAWVYAPGSWKDGRQYRPAAPLDRERLPAFPEALILRQARPAASPSIDENGCEDFDLASLQPPDWPRIREALSFIPPGCNRGEWSPVGMALCHVDGGSDFARSVWDEWSKGSPEHYKKREILKQWDSFRNDKASSVTIATLFHIAKQYGWDSAVPKTAEPSPLPMIDPAKWAGVDLPEREWALREWIPAGQATYLTGPGSAGKSLLAQQLCTCIALGLPFLGIDTRQANALYLTCEDDALELHRRQKAICASLGVTLESLSGRLSLVSLAGEVDTELCTFNDRSVMQVSKRYSALKDSATAAGITFVALDNVAHLFAGNENVRHDVAAFVALLNRLAMRIGGTVLFIGHPNKAGDSFSGSTAWENQVRSRLYMETPQDKEGPVDRDARTLTRQKANYARNGETVAFRWHEWAFAQDADLPFSVNEAAKAEMEDAAFLDCLAKATDQRRPVSPYPSAQNYAPRIFAEMPGMPGISKRGFEIAMQRLLDNGTIQHGMNVYRRDNRSWATGLGLAQNPAQNRAQNLHETCTDRAQNPAQNRTAQHPYTTYRTGAPPEGAPSDSTKDDLDPFDWPDGGGSNPFSSQDETSRLRVPATAPLREGPAANQEPGHG